MAAILRQRVSSAAQTMPDTVNEQDDDITQDSRFTQGLVAPNLLRSSPQHEGSVLKLHVPIFYSVLPLFLQTLAQKIPCISRLLAPRWERRHLILVGSFLYRFLDDKHPRKGPKGSPLALSAMSFEILSLQRLQDEVGLCPPPTGHVIAISTIRKRHYYAVQSREAASEWICALQLARQEAITRSMGHVPSGSFPKSWAYYDTIGANYAERKERIRVTAEMRNLQEMENSLNDAGPMASGYFT